MGEGVVVTLTLVLSPPVYNGAWFGGLGLGVYGVWCVVCVEGGGGL